MCSEKATDAGKNEEIGGIAEPAQEASRLVGHDEGSGKRQDSQTRGVQRSQCSDYIEYHQVSRTSKRSSYFI